jgi:hypothetical protein
MKPMGARDPWAAKAQPTNPKRAVAKRGLVVDRFTGFLEELS